MLKKAFGGSSLVFLISTVGMMTRIYAQGGGDGKAECDQPAIVAEYNEKFTSAEDWATLSETLNEFQSVVATCNEGYIWSGFADSQIGPIELEQGVYILEYTSTVDRGEVFNYFNVDLTSVTDESESEDYIIYDDFPGDESHEGEIVELKGGATLRLNGGKYLFELDLLNYQDWTVRLYKAD